MNKKVKLTIQKLVKTYKNGDGVKDINLTIYEDEIVTLLGPSGCGKTTILRALGGFESITSGQIILDGDDITNIPPEKRPTAMVFQSYNLWPHMTVYENLAFGLKLRKVAKAEIQTEITNIMEIMQMPGMEQKYPRQLSGGQQQRIAIARALLLKPEILLLDEPFSALDAKIRMQMREELKRIQQRFHITVVFVTHDQEEAMSLSNRIVVMNKGVISQVGSPQTIYENPVDEYVATFIGEMNFIPYEQKTDKVYAIRPEDIELQAATVGIHQGTIHSIMLLGAFASVIVESDFGHIKAFIPRAEVTNWQEQMPVSFSYKKYKVIDKTVMLN